MEYETTTVINRPISEVFARWAEIERFSEWWDPVVERRKMSADPVTIGTKYSAVDRLPLGKRLKSTLEIIAFQPNERITGRLSGNVDVTWDARFEEAGTGTRMTFRTVASLSGLLRLLPPLLAGWAKRIDRKALGRFKSSLEAEAP